MKISIPKESILATMPHMATKDTRYYMNGICIECRPNGDAVLVATNGASLAAVHVHGAIDEQDRPDKVTQIIIPDSALLPHKTAIKKARLNVTVTVGQAEDENKNVLPVTIGIDGVQFTCTSIDGRYPAWRQIIPRTVMGEKARPAINGEASHYDPKFIKMFAESAAVFGVKYGPWIFQNDNESAVVDIPNHPEFIGLIMPMRGPSVDEMRAWVAPAWAE